MLMSYQNHKDIVLDVGFTFLTVIPETWCAFDAVSAVARMALFTTPVRTRASLTG